MAALVAAGLVEEPDGLYLGRNPMRPEHDRLLPRSREGAGAGAGADTVRLLVPGFSYKTTAYVLWSRGARKPLQPTTSSPILTPQRATTEYTSPLVPRTSPPPPPPPPPARASYWRRGTRAASSRWMTSSHSPTPPTRQR